jgi:IS30 family transposase
MPTPGRPRALDEVKQAELCALMSQGCDVERAAVYVGCSVSTIRRELRRNKEFNDRLGAAIISSELDPLKAIRRAAEKDWRAGVWLLERLNPQRFGKQNVRFLKPEQLQQFIDQFAKAVFEEVEDEEMGRRVLRKANAFATKMEREARAAQHVAFPKPRRSRQRPAESNSTATEFPLPCREACSEHVELGRGEGSSPSPNVFAPQSLIHPTPHRNHASTAQ